MHYNSFRGDDDCRNNRLDVYGNWGFRFEYFINAVLSVGRSEVDPAEMNVYPNPTNGVFSIDLNDNFSCLLEIKDIAGQLIYSEQIEQSAKIQLNIYVLGLARGVYLIELHTEESAWVNKLIVP